MGLSGAWNGDFLLCFRYKFCSRRLPRLCNLLPTALCQNFINSAHFNDLIYKNSDHLGKHLLTSSKEDADVERSKAEAAAGATGFAQEKDNHMVRSSAGLRQRLVRRISLWHQHHSGGCAGCQSASGRVHHWCPYPRRSS